MIAAISIVGGIWGDFGRDQQGEINRAAQDSNDGTTIEAGAAHAALNIENAWMARRPRQICSPHIGRRVHGVMRPLPVFKDVILENHTVIKGESAFPLPSGRRQSGRLPPDNHPAEA
jgi:hypothetical protein